MLRFNCYPLPLKSLTAKQSAEGIILLYKCLYWFWFVTAFAFWRFFILIENEILHEDRPKMKLTNGLYNLKNCMKSDE